MNKAFSLLIATLILVLALPALAQDDQERKRRDHLVISIGEDGRLEGMDVVLPAATPRQVQRTMAPLLAYMACMDKGGSAEFCSSRADSSPTRSSFQVETAPAYGYYPGGYYPGQYGYGPASSVNNPFGIQYGYSSTEDELYRQYEYSQAYRDEQDRLRAHAVQDAQVDILREVVSGQVVLEGRVQATDERLGRTEERLDSTGQRLETVAGRTEATAAGLTETRVELDRAESSSSKALVGQQAQIQIMQRLLQKKEE